MGSLTLIFVTNSMPILRAFAHKLEWGEIQTVHTEYREGYTGLIAANPAGREGEGIQLYNICQKEL